MNQAEGPDAISAVMINYRSKGWFRPWYDRGQGSRAQDSAIIGWHRHGKIVNDDALCAGRAPAQQDNRIVVDRVEAGQL
jgi:hypothetical protein